MVLDKSKADVDVYDVLYADLNGNGDLTEPSEPFKAKDAIGSRSRFSLPDLTDPNSGIAHPELSLRATRGRRPTFTVSVMWRGKLKFGGGYARQGGQGYMRFAAEAKQAPIVWINGDGPFPVSAMVQ